MNRTRVGLWRPILRDPRTGKLAWRGRLPFNNQQSARQAAEVAKSSLGPAGRHLTACALREACELGFGGDTE